MCLQISIASADSIDFPKLFFGKACVAHDLHIFFNLRGPAGSNKHTGDLTIPQNPRKSHLRQRLAAGGGYLIEAADLLQLFSRDVLIEQEAAI